MSKLNTSQTLQTATKDLTSAPSGILQRKCACGTHTVAGDKCDECKNKKGVLQRKSSNNSEHSEVPPVVHEVLRSSGQSLDRATRGFMEPRFGHDFSQVRIHTDAKAAESAQSVNALAYTVGRDVVFSQGQYAPHTIEGRKLLAHELTHVVQQNNRSISRKQEVNPIDDYYEKEANLVAAGVTAALTVPDILIAPTLSPTAWLQRNEDGKEKSRQSKPRDAPRGTKPIDESGLDRDEVHAIKDGIGAGPRDWVGITPQGDVITTDADGNAENHGPSSSYLPRNSDAERRAREKIPDWVWGVIGVAVAAAIIACFATGVCEFGAVVAGLGYATALLIMTLLRSVGIRDSGATAAGETQGDSQEEAV